MIVYCWLRCHGNKVDVFMFSCFQYVPQMLHLLCNRVWNIIHILHVGGSEYNICGINVTNHAWGRHMLNLTQPELHKDANQLFASWNPWPIYLPLNCSLLCARPKGYWVCTTTWYLLQTKLRWCLDTYHEVRSMSQNIRSFCFLFWL